MVDPIFSVCMIVRDEERLLEECLRAVRDLADEVIVGDTGSTDRTPEIARDFGARLIPVPWNDNFSAARNRVLDKARGRWILTIDADERIRPISRPSLYSLLNNPHIIACYGLLHPMTGWTPMWVLRLFRNDPRIRYRGIFHETLREGLQEALVADKGELGYSALELDHVGYEGDQVAKHKRNLPLLLKAIEEDPEREVIWTHLGEVYEALGRDDLAEEAWVKGIELSRKKGGGYLYSYVYYLEWKLQRGRSAEGLLEEAMARFPENPYLFWLKGQLLMGKNQWEDAIPYLERLLAWGREQDFNKAFTYPKSIFDLAPTESLALCHFRLGNFDQSAGYFRLAHRSAPDRVEYRVKQKLCEALAGTGVQAEEPRGNVGNGKGWSSPLAP